MTIADVYRTLVPGAVRGPLSQTRHALWRHFTNGFVTEWRTAEVQRRLRQGRPLTTVRVGGLRLRVDLRDCGVGQPLFIKRRYEPGETALLRQLLRPGQTFLDVGANIGYFTTLAARLVGPGGRVLAVEPEPHNFDLLSGNVRANGFANVVTEQVALGDKPGTARLFCASHNFGDHRLYAEAATADRPARTIAVTTLDDLVARHGLPPADLIKMDVQGYECQVLAGMQSTLGAGGRMRVLTEFWPHGMRQAGGDPACFFDTFVRHGFTARPLTERGPGRPVSYAQALDVLPPFDPKTPDGCFINVLFER
jgi:FkbM family methyltransferase